MQSITVLCVVALGCILTLCSSGACNYDQFKNAENERKVDNLQFSEGLKKFQAKRMLNIGSPTRSVISYNSDKGSGYNNTEKDKYVEDGKKLTNEYKGTWNAFVEEQRHINVFVKALKPGDNDDEIEDGDELNGKRRGVYNFHGSFLKFGTQVGRVSNSITNRRDTEANGDYDEEVEDDTGYGRKKTFERTLVVVIQFTKYCLNLDFITTHLHIIINCVNASRSLTLEKKILSLHIISV